LPYLVSKLREHPVSQLFLSPGRERRGVCVPLFSVLLVLPGQLMLRNSGFRMTVRSLPLIL
jgi:hypothetical protein